MAILLTPIAIVMIVIAGITLTNMIFFPRLQLKTPHKEPFVSILIPARNEAAVIAQTLSLLTQQTYSHYEVIVLNDHSEDETGNIARKFGSARVRVIDGKPLPEGWLGKNWACHQLAQAAQGDILIFTDADVQWAQDGLAALVSGMLHSDADLFTVWPTQQTHTWSERLVVPMMALVVLAYLPVLGVHFTPLSIFAAANGQCMGWKRSSYFKVGGHNRVRDNVLEDVSLARIAKQHGLCLRMADGADLVRCRMYTTWASVRDGYAKNILAGYGGSIIFLLFAGIFHWMVFIFPLVVMIGTFVINSWEPWRWNAFILVIMGFTIRALTAKFTHQRVFDSLLMPISVLLMTRIAFRAIVWHFQGGPSWKGRKVANRRKAANNS